MPLGIPPPNFVPSSHIGSKIKVKPDLASVILKTLLLGAKFGIKIIEYSRKSVFMTSPLKGVRKGVHVTVP